MTDELPPYMQTPQQQAYNQAPQNGSQQGWGQQQQQPFYTQQQQQWQQPLPPLPPQQPQWQAPPAQPQAPPGNISVRLAAIEVWKKEKLLRTASIAGIAGFFIVAISTATSMYVGLGATALFSAAGIFLLYKSNMEVQRLQQKYNIDPKAN